MAVPGQRTQRIGLRQRLQRSWASRPARRARSSGVVNATVRPLPLPSPSRAATMRRVTSSDSPPTRLRPSRTEPNRVQYAAVITRMRTFPINVNRLRRAVPHAYRTSTAHSLDIIHSHSVIRAIKPLAIALMDFPFPVSD
jgi:hypothetical protein